VTGAAVGVALGDGVGVAGGVAVGFGVAVTDAGGVGEGLASAGNVERATGGAEPDDPLQAQSKAEAAAKTRDRERPVNITSRRLCATSGLEAAVFQKTPLLFPRWEGKKPFSLRFC
jgi:hypothetical protein